MQHHIEQGHYQISSGHDFMVSQAYYPSSASHPALMAAQMQIRSPSRIPQSQMSSGEMRFVDGPPLMSSQAFPDYGSSGFNLSEFTSEPTEAVMVAPIGDTPQFGAAPFPQASPEAPYVVPTVVRKKPSGFFRVLETFELNRVNFNFDDMIQEVIGQPSSVSSEMWSGLLTGSRFDRNYKIILALMEKVLTSIIGETVRRLRDECQAQQLAVFVRQIWTALLPVCAEVVEKYIVEYHKANHESFFKDETDEWDAEDEAREKRLDELDAELEALQAEIDGWEILERNFLNDDYAARVFVHTKQLFAQRLLFVNSAPVSSDAKFIDGGKIPQLAPWQHPEVRRKAQIRDALVADMQEALAGFAPFENEKIGIPVDGFCFEPGVKTDPRWDAWTSPGWHVLLPENYVAADENTAPASEAKATLGQFKDQRRLSLDAFSAFQ